VRKVSVLGFVEKVALSAPPKEVVKLKCPKCRLTFLNPQGLSSHMHTHRYVTNPVPAFFMTKETTPIICSAMVEHLLERTFDRVLPILAVTDTVSCLLEKVCLASAKDARIREQKAEVKARERKRDREDAVLEPGRRGSASRKRYTAHEKSVHLENFDKIVADAKVLNKGAEFESTYGIAASTISKWAGDMTRAAIAGALGQGYARKLLSLSKVNRKVGRYPAMEDAVAAELRSRRKRGRKCSPRWLRHAARHFMKTLFPDVASAKFRGGKDWRRRFLLRKKFSIRRNSNRKNVTWADARLVLARYFKKLRLRLSARDAGSTSVVDPKWGTYLPEDRANVDQMPLPFTNGMDVTYEEKGAERVAVNQGNDSWHKRQYTAQVAFVPAIAPRPTEPAALCRAVQARAHLPRQGLG